MTNHQSPVRIDYLTLAGRALVRGTSYLLIKRGLEVFSPTRVAALRLGGALLLAWAAPGAGGQTTQFAYAGFLFLACFCYATSSNLVGAYFRDLRSLTITVTSFFLVGIPALLWAGTQGAVVRTMSGAAGNTGWHALGYVAALAVLSTVLASILFFRMVQRTGAVFASTVSYIIPVIALGWGLLDGEALDGLQIPAIVLLLTGVFLSRRKQAA